MDSAHFHLSGFYLAICLIIAGAPNDDAWRKPLLWVGVTFLYLGGALFLRWRKRKKEQDSETV